MSALFTATVLCIVANVAIAVADCRQAPFVLRNSAQVRVPPGALPYLATAKLAGALGLTAGLVVAPWLGVVAGAALVVFFVGAIGAHLRARVLYNLAFPGLYLVLALLATTYLLQLATTR